MQITIDVTPDDLANIIVDNLINAMHCRNVLTAIIDKARKQAEIQSDEIEQIEYLLSEYEYKTEASKETKKE